MIAMGMMQPSAHEVIDMVAMGHDFVPTGRAMLVRAARLRRALHGIGGIYWDHVLVNVILVHVVKMAVMEIIDMAFMADRRPRALPHSRGGRRGCRVPFGARIGSRTCETWASVHVGGRGHTADGQLCSICSVVRTRDRVAGAGYACNARPDLHTICRSFTELSSDLSTKVCGGSKSAKRP
jgi:hypothetical protein